MNTDPKSQAHNFKILLVGPAGAGKEAVVQQLVAHFAPERGASREEGGVRTIGKTSFMGKSGTRVALTDLEVASLGAPEARLQRVRASTLGSEIVRTSITADDGFGIVLHVYWLPAELIAGRIQIGPMTPDWLRNTDQVVYVTGADRADAIDGLEDLEKWLGKYLAHVKVETFFGDVLRDGATAFTAIEPLASHLIDRVRAQLVAPPPPPKKPGRVRKKATKKKR